MTTPMFDVLSVLFDHFQDCEGLPSRESVLTRLMEEGCAHDEIGCAVRCLDALFYPHTVGGGLRTPSPASMRVFNTAERNILPDKVRGLLHFLGRDGNLDWNECEFVTRALMNLPPEEITVDNAKLLTLIRLWGSDGDLPPGIDNTLFDIFDERGTVH